MDWLMLCDLLCDLLAAFDILLMDTDRLMESDCDRLWLIERCSLIRLIDRE